MTDNSSVEAAVYAAAAGIPDANAAQLADSVSFMKTVHSLSPDSPGFVERVAEAARSALSTEPRFRLDAQQRSAGPASRPAEPKQWTLEDVRAAKGDPDAVTKAHDAGLLRDLGYEPRGTRGHR